MRLTEAEKDQRRRDQARVLRELALDEMAATKTLLAGPKPSQAEDVHTVLRPLVRDKTSVTRPILDATTYTYSPPPGFGPVRFARLFVAEL